MTWPIAIFASIVSIVALTFTFLLIIYFKEYRREEKLLEQYSRSKLQDQDLLPIYVLETKVPKAPKAPKTSATPKTNKGNKDIN